MSTATAVEVAISSLVQPTSMEKFQVALWDLCISSTRIFRWIDLAVPTSFCLYFYSRILLHASLSEVSTVELFCPCPRSSSDQLSAWLYIVIMWLLLWCKEVAKTCTAELHCSFTGSLLVNWIRYNVKFAFSIQIKEKIRNNFLIILDSFFLSIQNSDSFGLPRAIH